MLPKARGSIAAFPMVNRTSLFSSFSWMYGLMTALSWDVVMVLGQGQVGWASLHTTSLAGVGLNILLCDESVNQKPSSKARAHVRRQERGSGSKASQITQNS